ncbi:sensor histidine kinase [Nonomuraea africana]|uniref:histidine kinase n=1 Tax=Nonomuraea africana TaxID=46171 RepID=A0ABR9KVH7_9ACTN|nr:histidine kinase [Nonomuraea africana]MBE1566031.1 signal transduction histidine kinase [Nonomuraea africana]
MSLAGWMGRPWISGLALAVLVLALELPDALTAASPKAVLVGVGAAGLMLLSRRHPIPVALLVGALYVMSTQPPGYDAPVSAMLIALCQVGRHSAAAASVVVAVAGMATSWWLHRQVVDDHLPTGLSIVLMPALPLATGYIVRLRTELSRRREQQAAEHAVREERRRIARELHDVIAHHVSVVNLYMGVARRMIPIDAERARQTLLTGEDTARRAMAEMRQLLDVLRTAGEEMENQARVGVARLPALVEESGNAALEVTGEAVTLPTTVDHAVYRIVQEALTNTRKHAGGARSRVRLAFLPDLVEVEVADDGPARAGGPGLGLGLAGMAERVSLCGGELKAGPSPAGGFVVHARIPLLEKT